MKPSLARLVLYRLTEEEQNEMNQLGAQYDPPSKQESDTCAAAIVHCESNEENAKCNLCVLMAEGGYMFVKGVVQGTEKGQWHEPPRV